MQMMGTPPPKVATRPEHPKPSPNHTSVKKRPMAPIATHAPFAKKQPATVGPSDGHSIPLKVTGSGSKSELDRVLATFPSKDQELFGKAFRMTFSSDKSKRNIPRARAILDQLRVDHPKNAAIWRTLGYVEISSGNVMGAAPRKAYHQAIDFDPDYGEAHYALAFLYAMTDLTTGRKHFERAISLGVPDERNLGNRFYK